jgi:leader peptidase (prepilin peptidase) / N-methyltransferase
MNLLFTPIIFIYGTILGYLVIFLADVLPLVRKISQPLCVYCQREFSWKEFILLKNCPHCQKNNRRRKYIVISVFALLAVVCWIFPPVRGYYWVFTLLMAYFGVITVIDIEHRAILNETSLFGLILGFLFGWWTNGVSTTLIGGIAGFGIMLLLYWLGELFAKFLSRMRNEEISEVALGFGDVTLSGILGLMLGWPLILACLLFAILLGGLISGIIILYTSIKRSYKPFTAIPYAPFLILAAVVLLYLHK